MPVTWRNAPSGRRWPRPPCASTAQACYRTGLSWIQRGARARSAKAKGRIDRFETLQENVREAPPEAKLEIKSVATRLGKKILSCEHLGCEFEGRTDADPRLLLYAAAG